MRPKVSVICSHYNDGNYLPHAVDSILNQTFQDFEFVIVDDGSTDEKSLDVLADMVKLDPRIRVIYNSENRGPAYANHCASVEARGEYLHGVGADDIRYPRLLECAMEQFQKHPEVALCWAPFDWGREEDMQHENCGFGTIQEAVLLTPEEAQRRILEEGIRVYSGTAVYRRDCSALYGHYIDQLSYQSDGFLLNLILLNHPSIFLPETLAYFRVRGNNYSNKARHNKKNKLATYRYMLKWLNQKEHKLYREQFRKTALLTPLFHDLFWKMLFDIRYIHYWPYIAKKYPVSERIKRSLTKRFRRKLINS